MFRRRSDSDLVSSSSRLCRRRSPLLYEGRFVSAAIFGIIFTCSRQKSRASLPGPQPGFLRPLVGRLWCAQGQRRSPEAAAAMERLCRTYWYPLYCFVRRKGYSHEDASDLTQAFFALFLEKRYLKSVDAALGKFRTFLLASMETHCFLANEWDKSQTLKRGGGARVLSLDDATAEGALRPGARGKRHSGDSF